MAKIVVDSSVIIKWFVGEPLSEEAWRVLEGYQSGTLTLVAPDLLAAEIGNIVWKKHRWRGGASDCDDARTHGVRLGVYRFECAGAVHLYHR